MLSYYLENTTGHNVLFLDLLSIAAIYFGIAVIINKNPIESLILLIGLFGAISIYLIFSGLTFIGFSYLIVYIGAVSILFLFILMLIDVRSSELQSYNSNSIPLALFITIFLNFVFFQILPYYIAILNNYNMKINYLLHHLSLSTFDHALINIIKNINNEGYYNILFVTGHSWDGNLSETTHISSIGNILYTSYNIWLLIAGLILLLAMVGSILITVKPIKE